MPNASEVTARRVSMDKILMTQRIVKELLTSKPLFHELGHLYAKFDERGIFDTIGEFRTTIGRIRNSHRCHLMIGCHLQNKQLE